MSKQLQPNTERVLAERYYLRNQAGDLLETNYEQVCRRLGNFLGTAESNPTEYAERFFEVIYDQRLIPNSPVFFNFGNATTRPMGSACFILPVADDIRAIFKSVGDGAVISKFGGGIGMSFSNIRAKNSRTNQGGLASGALSFMRNFQTMSRTISQGGKRRGAMMAMLDVDHPEILEFIDCKLKTGPERVAWLEERFGLTAEQAKEVLGGVNWVRKDENGLDDWETPFCGFNISVKFSDDFMDALESKGLIPLMSEGRQWKQPVSDPRGWNDCVFYDEAGAWLVVDKFWDRFVESAWSSAEPGCCFIDTVNRDNSVASLGPIETSNPCGEFYNVAHSSCNLASLNLAKYFKPAALYKEWYHQVNWEQLAQDTRLGVRLLDDVISLNEYPIPEIDRVTKEIRPVGLGVMGFADLLLQLQVIYGSELSFEIGSRLQQFIQYLAWMESTVLAKERGFFPALVDNYAFFNQKMRKLVQDFFQHPALNTPNGENGRYGNHTEVMYLEGIDLESRYRQYGVRHCHVTVIAPTGTISLIGECSSSVEPVFAFEMLRRDTIGERSYVHPLLEAWEKKHPGQVRPLYFVDSHDVTPEQHVRMQAAFQKYCDNAVSKTANMPRNASREDIDQLYRLAWKLGLKGVTVYRDGSREGVLHRVEKKEPGEKAEKVVVMPKPAVVSAQTTVGALAIQKEVLERPDFLPGGTWRFSDGINKVYVTVNFDPERRELMEVFIRENGNNCWAELAGRLISLLMRSNVSDADIRQQLRRVHGTSTIWLNGRSFDAAPQAVEQVVFEMASKYFRNFDGVATLPEPMVEEELEANHLCCPKCQSQKFVPAGGCHECRDCGYSTCGGLLK